jgi:transcription initiation factor IIE alpha subunit
MSVGCAKLELTKGNKMELTAIGSRGLVEFVKVRTDLTEIGSYAYALTLVWSLADDKLKNKVIELIEKEEN